MGASNSKSRCQCAARNTLPPSYEEALRAPVHRPQGEDFLRCPSRSDRTQQPIPRPSRSNSARSIASVDRPGARTRYAQRYPPQRSHLHQERGHVHSHSRQHHTSDRHASDTRRPQTYPQPGYTTLSEPQHVSPSQVPPPPEEQQPKQCRIYASTIPCWDWDTAQCRAWLALLLVTRCTYGRPKASQKSDKIVRWGFGGSALYVMDLKSWESVLGYKDGLAVYSHLLNLRLVKGYKVVETRGYLKD